jgi:hypothetical protein
MAKVVSATTLPWPLPRTWHAAGASKRTDLWTHVQTHGYLDFTLHTHTKPRIWDWMARPELAELEKVGRFGSQIFRIFSPDFSILQPAEPQFLPAHIRVLVVPTICNVAQQFFTNACQEDLQQYLHICYMNMLDSGTLTNHNSHDFNYFGLQ